MKIIGYLLMAVITFCAVLIGAMAVSGNLNKESLDRLMGREEDPVMAVQTDDLDPYLQALKQERDAFQTRTTRLDQREAEIQRQEQELDTLRTELDDKLLQLEQRMQAGDAAQQQRLQDAATTLGAMKADKAAAVLDKYPNYNEAAEVLRLIESKDRGKILDAFTDPNKAALMVRTIQEGTT